jgi:N utilization substance protein B
VTTRSARRRAREYALQGLYQWRVAGNDVEAIAASLAEDEGFARADERYFSLLLQGTIAAAAELEELMAPALDRKPAELSPVERSILMMSTYELKHAPDVPYRVVINEAVELAKVYGGTDGYKYVNGVLDKLAASLRPDERSR